MIRNPLKLFILSLSMVSGKSKDEIQMARQSLLTATSAKDIANAITILGGPQGHDDDFVAAARAHVEVGQISLAAEILEKGDPYDFDIPVPEGIKVNAYYSTAHDPKAWHKICILYEKDSKTNLGKLCGKLLRKRK